MSTEEIKKLLEKYYNAESSEEEELILRKFFCEEDIPGDLLEEKEIFSYFSRSEVVPEPSAGLEERIISEIDKKDSSYGTGQRRKLILSFVSIAAGFLILAGSFYFFIHRTEPGDTFSDPDIAYAETMKILYDVSSRLNQGTQALELLGKIQDVTIKSLKTINKSTIIIEDKLKTLDHFRNAIEIISDINSEKTNK
jgi:hypothetical protein